MNEPGLLNITDDEAAKPVRLSHHPNMDNNPVRITDEILSDLYNYLRR